jgi:hypothetical protein
LYPLLTDNQLVRKGERMKIKEFQYYKEKEGMSKNYKVIAIKEDDNYIEGVSLNDLTEEKQNEVMEIVKDFEAKLEPFMAQYRKFKKSLIIY